MNNSIGDKEPKSRWIWIIAILLIVAVVAFFIWWNKNRQENFGVSDDLSDQISNQLTFDSEEATSDPIGDPTSVKVNGEWQMFYKVGPAPNDTY